MRGIIALLTLFVGKCMRFVILFDENLLANERKRSISMLTLSNLSSANACFYQGKPMWKFQHFASMTFWQKFREIN